MTLLCLFFLCLRKRLIACSMELPVYILFDLMLCFFFSLFSFFSPFSFLFHFPCFFLFLLTAFVLADLVKLLYFLHILFFGTKKKNIYKTLIETLYWMITSMYFGIHKIPVQTFLCGKIKDNKVTYLMISLLSQIEYCFSICEQ